MYGGASPVRGEHAIFSFLVRRHRALPNSVSHLFPNESSPIIAHFIRMPYPVQNYYAGSVRWQHFRAPHIHLGNVCSAFGNARSDLSENTEETSVSCISDRS